MRIMNKFLSLALSSAIVLGCGAAASADTTRYAINSVNFPDAEFRALIQKDFDANNDGWLDYSERTRESYEITGSKIRSIEGINLLNLKQLMIRRCRVDEIDLSTNRTIEHLLVFSCNRLTDFIGSAFMKNIELDLCEYLQNVDLTYCRNVEILSLVHDENLEGTLNLSMLSNLQDFTLYQTQVSDIRFNRNAIFKQALISGSNIKNLDISNNLDLNSSFSFILATGGNLASLRVSGEVLNLLWNHRKPDNTGYLYQTQDQYISIG